MSFADVVAASRTPDPKKDRLYRNEDTPETAAAGLENEDSEAYDPKDLSGLGSRLKEVRLEIASLKKEEEKLRKMILVHPESKVGYSNPYISIGGEDRLVKDDPKLIEYLEKNGLLDKVSKRTIEVRKLRRLGEDLRDDPDVPSELERLFVYDKGRKLKITK